MLEKKEPLLLLDNSSMYVVGAGDYHSTDLSFEEAKAIIDMYDTPDILRCYTIAPLTTCCANTSASSKGSSLTSRCVKWRVGQDAIAIKRHITKSETQPEVQADDGVTAKKIQNVYVYCQYITRIS